MLISRCVGQLYIDINVVDLPRYRRPSLHYCNNLLIRLFWRKSNQFSIYRPKLFHWFNWLNIFRVFQQLLDIKRKKAAILLHTWNIIIILFTSCCLHTFFVQPRILLIIKSYYISPPPHSFSFYYLTSVKNVIMNLSNQYVCVPNM